MVSTTLFSQSFLTESSNSTSAVAPVTFKVGDLAEVQITFTMVPLKEEEWRIIPTLRCVTLLDGRFTQVRDTPTVLGFVC